MAKKFGKFLLFTAAVGTAAAAAYYYMQQKDSQLKESSDADDDYDDFHEDLDKSTEFSRNYVPLNTPVQTSAPKEETGTESTPASEEAAPASVLFRRSQSHAFCKRLRPSCISASSILPKPNSTVAFRIVASTIFSDIP